MRRIVVLAAALIAPVHAASAAEAEVAAAHHPAAIAVDSEVGFHHGGYGVAVGLDAEWEGFGLAANVDTLRLEEEAGEHTPWQESVVIASLLPGFEVAGGRAGHVRVAAGLDGIFAQGHAWVGPALALQIDAGLFGPIGAELMAELTPLPFTRVDAQAGLAVHLAALDLRGGWRHLELHDNGLVDDEDHDDVLDGPYVGVGMHF